MKGKYNLDMFNQNADKTEVLFIERVNIMFQNIEERINNKELSSNEYANFRSF